MGMATQRSLKDMAMHIYKAGQQSNTGQFIRNFTDGGRFTSANSSNPSIIIHGYKHIWL
jgi:hypothetical protein